MTHKQILTQSYSLIQSDALCDVLMFIFSLKPSCHVFLSFLKSQFTIHRIPRSREVRQSWSSSVLSSLSALMSSVPLVFRLQPDMVGSLSSHSSPIMTSLSINFLSSTGRLCNAPQKQHIHNIFMRLCPRATRLYFEYFIEVQMYI